MFSIGDTVVYPVYGAGIIVNIETVRVKDKTGTYYVIDLPNGNLKVRLSVEKADELGLRKISEKDDIEKAIKSVCEIPIENFDSWNQRYKENLEKIRTGSLEKVAEVYRNLYLRDKEKGLSGGEKKMLNNARQIIVSEIVMACGLQKDSAESYLNQALFG